MSKYSGSLTREQFLFRESRIIAKLIIEGYDDSMIIDLVYKDNLFQFPTEKWIKNLVNVCIGRVRGLDNMGLINQLAYGPLDLAKQINLYSIMKSNRLVKEFMIEVVGSKLRLNESYLSRVDLNLFFIHLQEQNEDVNKWTDSTLQRIKQVLIKFLIELGYMKSLRDGHLQPIYIYPELIDGIKLNRDNDMLIVFNGVNEQ